MNRLWRIKHWLKYEPSIAFDRFMAWLFHGLFELTDRLAYLIFGKERWEITKEKEECKEQAKADGIYPSCLEWCGECNKEKKKEYE